MSIKNHRNQHPTVRFQRLVIGDRDEIHLLENQFMKNGWCFIELPQENGELALKLETIKETLTEFFSYKQSDKNVYESSTAFGYTRVNHKEGIKVLTNRFGLDHYHKPLTVEIEQTLQGLATLMRHFTDTLTSIILNMPTMSQSSARSSVELSPLTMLDIVQYFNKTSAPTVQPEVGLNTKEVNCVPHFDPGLFSLSILSTNEGLQLKDLESNQWIDGPINDKSDKEYIGAIWLGEAATTMTNNQFKSGIHRVVYPQTTIKPRLTIWQEVCTSAQIQPLLQPNGDEKFFNDNSNILMLNQPDSIPFPVKKGGENRKQLMNRIEYDRGISISKSRPHHIRRVKNNDMGHHDSDGQMNSNYLPEGATVLMKNQPNSIPMAVEAGGENLSGFMKRIEIDRGLSMSKSGFEHLSIRFPVKSDDQTTKDDKKKTSFFSKLFK